MAEPTAPWWSNLISILLTAIVSVVGTMYIMKSGVPQRPGMPAVPSIGGLIKDTITYIPHILLLFGVLADMFTYAGVYSIPSIVGLLSIPLNYVMKYFWTGVEDVAAKIAEIASWKGSSFTLKPAEAAAQELRRAKLASPTQAGGDAGQFFREYDGCNVQGFGWMASRYAPQTLVVTATVFAYYMFDLIANRGWVNAAGTIVIFSLLYIAETLIIGSCAVDGDMGPGTLLKSVAALTEGLLFGGSSYAIVQSYYPTKLPSSVISPFPRKSKNDLKVGENGVFTDDLGLPYVCLPNGQCVPDLSKSADRSDFAKMAAASIGSQAPAKPFSCAD